MLQRIVNGIAGQGCAALDINLRICKFLSDQCLKDGFVLNQVSAESRCFLMFGNLYTEDLPLTIYRNIDGECLKTGHLFMDGFLGRNGILCLRCSRSGFICSGSGLIRSHKAILRRSLFKRFVDGVAGQGCTAPDINLSRGDILANQCLKDGRVSDQVCAESRRFPMLGNLPRW